MHSFTNTAIIEKHAILLSLSSEEDDLLAVGVVTGSTECCQMST